MKLAILGAGDVGRSVADLAGEYGHDVVALADSTTAAVDANGIAVRETIDRKVNDDTLGTADPDDIFETEYDVLVEATPTTLGDAQPGFSHAKRTLTDDRHVVLANKGPVAERYEELQGLEAESAGSVRFEATVGGAIPVLSTIEDETPQAVTAIRGVLNGTANFILTRMAAEGLDYEHVLAEAQDLGVAEADPTFDVDGTDAALKFVILANVLADGGFSLSDATVDGIENIPGSALDLAAEDGRTIRLIGEATRDGVRVGPRLVPENSALAVTGTRNIVQIETRHAGSLHSSGRGAGGPETATAVLSDIGRLPPLE
ncbi:homoserine dehydrogenase [Natronobacterium gregoryi]|uniref:homoserine dehydrogenase n=2 Tax=Natronobacterium gregoryi TaxID=44930 RepID=L0AG65_NATGS|nr:homoserine dehydrogenase [Natronobacterium gregoryi]AFZ72127.1 homoserine dehydrogenase [Natronobacterium gregoryi SP2]ELY62843.1 homoserine dehydrogenase [Natronobacterium gregoryi SP2]PLK19270.1 homoserine dehydrogenase [Natronobacterium gregoryi SP2]SFJ54983.1 homoserine dehydrogenase [Natronobacterium gregoryi]